MHTEMMIGGIAVFAAIALFYRSLAMSEQRKRQELERKMSDNQG